MLKIGKLIVVVTCVLGILTTTTSAVVLALSPDKQTTPEPRHYPTATPQPGEPGQPVTTPTTPDSPTPAIKEIQHHVLPL